MTSFVSRGRLNLHVLVIEETSFETPSLPFCLGREERFENKIARFQGGQSHALGAWLALMSL